MNLKNLCSLLFIFPCLVLGQSTEKTILFLDMNNNPKEIAVARKGAKARGEKLIVIPANVSKEKNENHYYDIKNELKSVIEKNIISSVVLSGHNGGDSYSGVNGAINVSELMEVLDQSQSKNEIKSIYLLGCNTANKSKIFFWKASLPNLKFIAGYDGSAPYGHFANGLGYFEDALLKEKTIVQTSDAVKIKSLFESLRYINSFQASLYTCDPNDNSYLFMSGRKGKHRFGKLDASDCIQKLNEYQTKYLPELRAYWGAKKEPTELNPSSGFLKDAYVFMRQNEHCITGENQDGIHYEFNGDNLLFLRFNKEFNQNFVNYYRPILEEVKNDLDLFTSDPDKYYEKLVKDINESENSFKELRANSAKRKALLTDEHHYVQKQKDEILAKNPGMRQCLENMNPQCQRFRRNLTAYYDLHIKSYLLKDDDYIDFVIQEEKVPTKEDFLKSAEWINPKEKFEKIRKLLQSPGDVKRADLLDLAHSVHYLPRTEATIQLKIILKSYEKMSGDVFPFSWHEIAEDQKIEAPFSKNYQVETILDTRRQLKNPELKYLMRRISEQN